MIAKLQKSKFLNRVEGKKKFQPKAKKKFSKLKATQKKFKPVPKQQKKNFHYKKPNGKFAEATLLF